MKVEVMVVRRVQTKDPLVFNCAESHLEAQPHRLTIPPPRSASNLKRKPDRNRLQPFDVVRLKEAQPDDDLRLSKWTLCMNTNLCQSLRLTVVSTPTTYDHVEVLRRVEVALH